MMTTELYWTNLRFWQHFIMFNSKLQGQLYTLRLCNNLHLSGPPSPGWESPIYYLLFDQSVNRL